MNARGRVLIVDDDAAMTFHLSRYLALAGFEVEQVNEARRALAVAQAFQPEAVILDYAMPELDGAEVAWQFHSDPALKFTPKHPEASVRFTLMNRPSFRYWSPALHDPLLQETTPLIIA